MKKKHLSVDMMNLEKHYDKFNIDFIRYFTRHKFGINIFASVAAMSYWLSSGLWEWSLEVPLRSAINAGLLGAFFFLILFTTIAYAAGNSFMESLRLSSRRCLFSFTTMNLAIWPILFLSGVLTWIDLFSWTLTLGLWGNLVCGYTAVTLDIAIPLIYKLIYK